MEHFEEVLRLLRTAGFSVEMTVHAYRVIYGYVYGRVLAFNRESRYVQAQQIMGRAAADRYPYSNEIITEYVLRPGSDDMDDFESGLDLILGGLERFLYHTRSDRDDDPVARDAADTAADPAIAT